jgi:hypothetical protein
MPAILDVLLAVHFFGLMLGAAGGMGGGMVAGFASSLPADKAAAVKEVGPMLTGVSMIGLIVMVASGVALLLIKYGEAIPLLPLVFWFKLVFVATLAISAGLMLATYGQIKRGNAAAESRLRILGPISGISALAAVVFAVLTFH